MTRDEILALPAGEELDALVAEKVMGCAVQRHLMPNGTPYATCPDGEHASTAFDGEPNEYLTSRANPFSPRRYEVAPYSTDIAAAWLVMVKLLDCNPRLGGYILDGRQTWGLYLSAPDGLLHAEAESAPLAICRAALLSVEKPPS